MPMAKKSKKSKKRATQNNANVEGPADTKVVSDDCPERPQNARESVSSTAAFQEAEVAEADQQDQNTAVKEEEAVVDTEGELAEDVMEQEEEEKIDEVSGGEEEDGSAERGKSANADLVHEVVEEKEVDGDLDHVAAAAASTTASSSGKESDGHDAAAIPSSTSTCTSVATTSTTTTTTTSGRDVSVVGEGQRSMATLQKHADQMMEQLMGDHLMKRLDSMSEKYKRLQQQVVTLQQLKKEKEKSTADVERDGGTVEEERPVGNASDKEHVESTLREMKKRYREKEEEFETHKRKVAEWKEKVKIMTKKDMQRLEHMKKLLKEKEERIQEMDEEIELFKREKQQQSIGTVHEQDTPDPLMAVIQERKFTIRETVAVDGHVWCCLSYTQDGKDSQNWVSASQLQTVQQDLELPLTLEQKLNGTYDKETEKIKSQHGEELEKLRNLATSHEDELKRYKARAHAALKKTTESLSSIKIDHEKAISSIQEVLNQTKEENRSLSIEKESLKKQIESLMSVQEHAVQLDDQLKLVTKERDELSEKVNDAKQHIEVTVETHQSELKQLREEHAQQLQQAEESKKQSEEYLGKELALHRDQMRKRLDEKEREVAKLQKRVTNLKAEAEKRREQKEDTPADDQKLSERELISTPTNALVTPPTELSLSSSHPNSVILSTEDAAVSYQTDLQDEQQQQTATTQESSDKDESTLLRQALSSSQEAGQYFDVALDNSSPQPQQSNVNMADGFHNDLDEFMKLAQMQASRDRELQEYKQTVQQLREHLLQKETTEKRLKQSEERLRQHIDYLEKLQNQDTPNLQYLKNVMIKFLEANDATIRQKLFNVITTLLEFEEDEKDRMRQLIDNGGTAASSSTGSGFVAWMESFRSPAK